MNTAPKYGLCISFSIERLLKELDLYVDDYVVPELVVDHFKDCIYIKFKSKIPFQVFTEEQTYNSYPMLEAQEYHVNSL